jgi:hypothetical protein
MQQQLPALSNNSQSTLLTLHDSITDSPVYRSSTLHFDEQLDLLEKWLENLTKYMKQYITKLNRKVSFNTFFGEGSYEEKKN